MNEIDVRPILEFQGEYRFLSNFYPSPIVDPAGDVYPTVEHAFQAAKTMDEDERYRISQADSPGFAKRLGRKVQLRPAWDAQRVGIMFLLVKTKFEQHEDLEQKLIATGCRPLIEGNYWFDTFWGVCKGKGANKLGTILECVRAERRMVSPLK